MDISIVRLMICMQRKDVLSHRQLIQICTIMPAEYAAHAVLYMRSSKEFSSS